jgi:uncharacterized protein (TIGR00296 family)
LKPKETPQLAEINLSLEEGKILVQLARTAISTYLEKNQIIRPPQNTPDKLFRKSGIFVTLNQTKPTRELRGCIGFPYPEEPLVNATIKAAIYAATEDPRFEPVRIDELRQSIVIELTVLTEPQTLHAIDRKALPNLIHAGQHGLIVAGKGTSGLLLPQVATEWNWDASEFLMNCCLKAGLPPDSWLLDGVEVKVFEGEIFEETEPAGAIRRKKIGEK